jgi:cytochrome c
LADNYFVAKISLFTLACVAVLAAASLKPSHAATFGPSAFTRTEAIAGVEVYAARCSICHGAHMQGVLAPALRGANSALAGDSLSKVFTFMSTQMPAGNPGSLSSTDYINLMAFILSRNGYVTGADGETLVQAPSRR